MTEAPLGPRPGSYGLLNRALPRLDGIQLPAAGGTRFDLRPGQRRDRDVAPVDRERGLFMTVHGDLDHTLSVDHRQLVRPTPEEAG